MLLSKNNNVWIIDLCGNYDDAPSTIPFGEFCKGKKDNCSDCRLFYMKKFIPISEYGLQLKSGTFCLLFGERQICFS